MRIKRFNENINLDTTYEIRYYDNELGDEIEIVENDEDANYNPFDIKDMVKLLMIRQEEHSEELYLVKVHKEKVGDQIINKIKLELEAEKYNL